MLKVHDNIPDIIQNYLYHIPSLVCFIRNNHKSHVFLKISQKPFIQILNKNHEVTKYKITKRNYND